MKLDTHVNIYVIKCSLLVLNLTKQTVSGQLPPRKITPLVRVRVWISVRVRIRFWRQFSSGGIVPERNKQLKKKKILRKSLPNL